MDANAVRRLQRTFQTPSGRNMLNDIAKIDKRVPYMIAGAAHESRMPTGLARYADLGTALALAPHALNPAMWPTAAGTIAAATAFTSPRFAGRANYGLGAASRLARSLPIKGAYYTGLASQPGGAPPDQPQGGGFRNERTNNMGMIKDSPFARAQPGYVGSDGTFAKFATPEAGIEASRRLVTNKINSGLNTPDKLVESWAPATENSPAARAAYKQRIANAVGIGIDDPIPPEAVDAVLEAMAVSEGAPIHRATGGRASINHEAEAESMIRRAETIKKGLGKSTEPLLNASDDHIAKALSVANESI
jgi:hypothetical protein